MGFLLFLGVFVLFFFLIIISFGLSILRGVLSIFFPFLRKSSQSFNGQQREESEFRTNKGKRDKIFNQAEGEYADYEEVK